MADDTITDSQSTANVTLRREVTRDFVDLGPKPKSPTLIVGETRITIRGPLGEVSQDYPSIEAALGDIETWSVEYDRQWRAMPWWWRVWSRACDLCRGEAQS